MPSFRAAIKVLSSSPKLSKNHPAINCNEWWPCLNLIVAGAELRLVEGSTSAQPSMCPCSIKRCQFPRASAYALTIKS